MIKTLIFDLGGVIVPLDFPRGYAAIARYCGLSAAEIPKRIGSTDLVTRFETGLVAPEDFVREISALLELQVSYDTFCELWSSIFPEHTLIPDSLMEQLGEQFPLVLLSNTNAIHFEMIRSSYPILRHFDRLVLSYEVGAMKPASKIYSEAIAQAGCRPEECFFTDDVAAYVEGAKREGIDAVQFRSCEQLREDLAARGIA